MRGLQEQNPDFFCVPTMNQPDHHNADIAARRKAARRTALWIAGVAVLIYVVFILSGTLGQ